MLDKTQRFAKVEAQFREVINPWFIQPDGGGQDVFVHISAVERAGMNDLQEGQKISFELEDDRKSGKNSAGKLKQV